MLVKTLFLLLFVAEGLSTIGLPKIPNGECTRGSVLVNGRWRMRRKHIARFQCNPGYELVGNKYAACTKGAWDEPPPVCIRPSDACVIPELKNGIVMAQRRDALLNFFCVPGYQLQGPSSIYCDGHQWNTSVPTCMASTAGDTTSSSCDFESPDLCGWRQDERHDFDWRRHNKKTPSSFLNTGPKFDHTYGPGKDGYYMYIESTARITNSVARLLSPVYDSSVARHACFQFYYHMFGLSTGGLRVYQKTDRSHDDGIFTEDSTSLLFELYHNQGDFWHRGVVPLKDNNEDFQLVIEGIRGVSFTSDIAIDDVAILRGENCTRALQDVAVPTSTAPPVDSCAGRCLNQSLFEDISICSCSTGCLGLMTCCPDYLDVCVFERDGDPNDDNLNAKEKLDDSTTEESTTVTTKKATTKPTPPLTTTQKPTTTAKATPKPTTTLKTTTTIKPTTTQKPTSKAVPTRTQPIIKLLTTEKIINANDDIALQTIPTTVKPLTTTKPTTTTKTLETTTKKPKLQTTQTTVDSDMIVDVPAGVKEVFSEANKKVVPEVSKSASSSVPAVLSALAALTVLATLVGLLAARAHRPALLARLRGRVRHDPEVRYLTRDDE